MSFQRLATIAVFTVALAALLATSGDSSASVPTVVPTSGFLLTPFQGGHVAIDIAGSDTTPPGKPVYALADGKVVRVYRENGSWGCSIVLDHGDQGGGKRLFSIYAHMGWNDEDGKTAGCYFDVAQGQSVSKGKKIGNQGNAGQATGVHLHFGTYLYAGSWPAADDDAFDPRKCIGYKETYTALDGGKWCPASRTRADFSSTAVAACDFNGDGREDVAIGVPKEDLKNNTATDAGAVNVLYGSAGGLTASGSQMWHQDVPWVRGGIQKGDMFGAALACGDFNGDGRDDLAIGVPKEDLKSNRATDAGAVNVLYGSGGGLTTSGNQMWHQDVPWVRGGIQKGDMFGAALAAGDFNGDGRDDLAIGVPKEDLKSNTATDAGAVNVLYGSGARLTTSGNQMWHQDVPGVPGGIQKSDQFGGLFSPVLQ